MTIYKRKVTKETLSTRNKQVLAKLRNVAQQLGMGHTRCMEVKMKVVLILTPASMYGEWWAAQM